MRATEWVEPGEGATVGELWDLVINSWALRHAPDGVRAEFLSHGAPTESERARRTRLGLMEEKGVLVLGLGWYDIERVTAAIWEYDQ